MTKDILASASFYNKKYYFNDKYKELPTAVKQEIKEICLKYVQMFKCILLIGFYENGEIFFETQVLDENQFSFMEIDSKLELKKIEEENVELLEGLQKWWILKEGQKVRETGK